MLFLLMGCFQTMQSIGVVAVPLSEPAYYALWILKKKKNNRFVGKISVQKDAVSNNNKNLDPCFY